MERNDNGQLVAQSLNDIASHIEAYASICRYRKHIDKRTKSEHAADLAQETAYQHAAQIIRETILRIPELEGLPDSWGP